MKLLKKILNNNIQINSDEKGAALIIALGILALILALGLNFASQSIINDKIAKNFDNKTRAEILANTSMNRFFTDIASNPDTPLLYSYTENNSDNPEEDLLSAVIGNINYQGNPETRWLYIYNKTTGEADSEIIGRIAYSACNPGGGDSSDSMNYGEIGKINIIAAVDSQTVENSITEDTDLYTSYGVPGRPGVNINEIYLIGLDETFMDNTDSMQLLSSSNADNSVTATLSGSGPFNGQLQHQYWLDMETVLKTINIAPSASEIKNRLYKKITLSKINDPEAFWIDNNSDDIISDTDELYHRFNIARTDWDSITVESLAKTNPILYSVDDSDSDGITIPWVKNWKNQGTMNTLEAAQKQIMANLIDYNDSNYEATTDDEDNPTYTGNDKTPYINEVNLEIEGKIKAIKKDDYSTATIRFCSVDIEAVNIYNEEYSNNEIMADIEFDFTFTFAGGPPVPTPNTVSTTVSFSKISVKSYTADNERNVYEFVAGASGTGLGISDFKISNMKAKLYNNNYSTFCDYSFVENSTGSPGFELVPPGETQKQTIYLDYSIADPRQNLNDSDWGDPIESTGTLGTVNIIDTSSYTDTDIESSNDPTTFSTAYIRNAPMKSPWELGFIHRSEAYRTINLKKYNNTENVNTDAGGNSYVDGDTNILDQIKMQSANSMPGKVNLNNPVTPDDTYNPLSALFYGIRLIGKNIANTENPGYYNSSSDIFVDIISAYDLAQAVYYQILYADNSFITENMFKTRGQLLTNITDFSGNALQNNDALKEEIIGKFINLTKADGKIYSNNNITLLLLAQSIKDSGGINKDIPITRKINGNTVTINTRKGRYDKNGDSILSTQKALVTLIKDPISKKWIISNFEFIGD